MSEPKPLEWPAVDLQLNAWHSLTPLAFELPLKFYEDGLPAIHPNIEVPVECFLFSTMGYCSLTLFPSSAYQSGRQTAFAEVAACMELYGTPRDPSGAFAASKEIAELRDEYLSGRKKPPISIISGTDVVSVFDLSMGFVRKQYVSLMVTQIVACWTAFETIARDLWIEAVNARPRLGVRALGAEILGSDDDDQKEKKRKKKFPFSPTLLAKWNYDLTNHMGDLLAHDKFEFDRKDNSRKAYEAAFESDCATQIKDIFGSEKLGWLCAVRNNLVHRAGIVDEALKRQFPAVENIPSDGKHRIPIDGKMCFELVQVGCEAGIALAKMVESWLNSHPI